jgi:hypothetical protein
VTLGVMTKTLNGSSTRNWGSKYLEIKLEAQEEQDQVRHTKTKSSLMEARTHQLQCRAT